MRNGNRQHYPINVQQGTISNYGVDIPAAILTVVTFVISGYMWQSSRGRGPPPETVYLARLVMVRQIHTQTNHSDVYNVFKGSIVCLQQAALLANLARLAITQLGLDQRHVQNARLGTHLQHKIKK